MKTREQLEKILTLKEVEKFFTTKESAIEFFEIKIENYKRDLQALDKVDKLLNQNLYPLSINNKMVSESIKEAETSLRKTLESDLMALIADSETKKDIISKL